MKNTYKAWRLHAHNDLRFDEVETPEPAPDGVVVRIEAGMVQSRIGRPPASRRSRGSMTGRQPN